MVTIRNVEQKDIREVVQIHVCAFPDFFLTSLGEDFLEFYYSKFLKSRDSVFLCAEEDNKLLGFSAAAIQSKGFNTRLLKKSPIGFFWISLKLAFKSPLSLIRLVRNLTKKSDTIEDPKDYAELYSIGVQTESQGKGIGKQLLSYSEYRLKEHGAKRLSLTTDFFHNESTLFFYKKYGFNVYYEFTSYPNRRMYRLIKQI